MRTILLFANHKGGTGKTTLCRELGIWLGMEGEAVLWIDGDPQANLTKSLGDVPATGLYEALTGNEWEFARPQEGLHLLAGGMRLALLEKQLLGELDAYGRVRDLVEGGAFEGFTYILMDTPPSLGLLTVNALTAATHVVIPMNPAIYSMQGTSDLLDAVMKVKKTLNPSLAVLGFIVNGYDPIPVITRQIVEEIRDAFGARVFGSFLSRSIRVEEAIAQKKGVVQMKGAGKVRGEVARLGAELVSRLEGTHGEG